jgi:hypothetical protein
MTAVKTLALVLLALVLAVPATSASVMYEPSYYTDAYLNMSDGPYDEAGNLTDGNAKPWYLSPVVDKLYGGVPNAKQQLDFENTIYARVKETYALSGVPIELTNSVNDPVAHALSVVSGTYSPANSDAVGITTVGGSGFSFIDGLKYAKSIDQLEWAVAHNVAHELMHAFGAGHHDTTGNYLDAAVTSWETLVNPNAVFSPDAVQDLQGRNFRQYQGAYASYGGSLWGGQQIAAAADGTLMAAPVPEPAVVGLWVVGGAGLVLVRRRSRRAA